MLHLSRCVSKELQIPAYCPYTAQSVILYTFDTDAPADDDVQCSEGSGGEGSENRTGVEETTTAVVQRPQETIALWKTVTNEFASGIRVKLDGEVLQLWRQWSAEKMLSTIQHSDEDVSTTESDGVRKKKLELEGVVHPVMEAVQVECYAVWRTLETATEMGKSVEKVEMCTQREE
uniref:Uncharacterized protein n=2 Tax=Lygus hesperus TaxID=30085 RepID=A0A146LIX8_LYGHE